MRWLGGWGLDAQKERTMTDDKQRFLINIDVEGRVSLVGGLIFHPGGFVHADMPSSTALGGHTFYNNYVIGSIPRWWQVSRWWRLVRLINRHMTPNVRAKRATTAGRQARAGDNVQRTTGPGLVACRWRSA